MIENLKKYVKSEVYEENAEYPWAQIKDFVISENGENIVAAKLQTISLIPVPYVVKFEDFKVFGRKKCVLKQGSKPSPAGGEKLGIYFFSQLKGIYFGEKHKRFKLKDADFMVEVGEIVDYIAKKPIIGEKVYINSSDLKINELCFYKERRGIL